MIPSSNGKVAPNAKQTPYCFRSTDVIHAKTASVGPRVSSATDGASTILFF